MYDRANRSNRASARGIDNGDCRDIAVDVNAANPAQQIHSAGPMRPDSGYRLRRRCCGPSRLIQIQCTTYQFGLIIIDFKREYNLYIIVRDNKSYTV